MWRHAPPEGKRESWFWFLFEEKIKWKLLNIDLCSELELLQVEQLGSFPQVNLCYFIFLEASVHHGMGNDNRYILLFPFFPSFLLSPLTLKGLMLKKKKNKICLSWMFLLKSIMHEKRLSPFARPLNELHSFCAWRSPFSQKQA